MYGVSMTQNHPNEKKGVKWLWLVIIGYILWYKTIHHIQIDFFQTSDDQKHYVVIYATWT